MNRDSRILVVGAGFAGSVCAERLASAGKKVLLIDRRTHVGGNAYDETDSHGVLVHRYGPHIFHTNSKRVFEYLSRFTHWRFYEHRVRAVVNGISYPFPINRITINTLYGLELSEDEVQCYFRRVALARDRVATSEDLVLSTVGEDLCNKFFRNYTKKQWGLDLSQLSVGVAARIPLRCNDDDRYFGDSFQFMPAEGYTAMFLRMLDHPNIDIQGGVDFADIRDRQRFERIIYTGPVDEYFKFCLGHLSYRSLRFEHEHISDTQRYQETATINYPNDHAFTRITEFRHLTGQRHSGTSIVREYPLADGDPYYPIPRPENETLYRQYRDLTAELSGVTFVGRLAEYRYYNMDQVVAAALTTIDKLLWPDA